MAAGEEVGLSPGSYRIIDLYCFREVLNQIMKVPLLLNLPSTRPTSRSDRIYVALWHDRLVPWLI